MSNLSTENLSLTKFNEEANDLSKKDLISFGEAQNKLSKKYGCKNFVGLLHKITNKESEKTKELWIAREEIIYHRMKIHEKSDFICEVSPQEIKRFRELRDTLVKSDDFCLEHYIKSVEISLNEIEYFRELSSDCLEKHDVEGAKKYLNIVKILIKSKL